MAKYDVTMTDGGRLTLKDVTAVSEGGQVLEFYDAEGWIASIPIRHIVWAIRRKSAS